MHLKLARHMAALLGMVALLVLCIIADIYSGSALLVTLTQRARSAVGGRAEWLEPPVRRRSTLKVAPILEVRGTYIVRRVWGEQMSCLTSNMCARPNIGRRDFAIAMAWCSLTPATLVAYMAARVMLAAEGIALADWHKHAFIRARRLCAIVCHIVLRCHRSMKVVGA